MGRDYPRAASARSPWFAHNAPMPRPAKQPTPTVNPSPECRHRAAAAQMPPVAGGTVLKVLMTRRSDKASFVPGAYKLPAAASRPRTATAPATRAGRPPPHADRRAPDRRHAAIRGALKSWACCWRAAPMAAGPTPPTLPPLRASCRRNDVCRRMRRARFAPGGRQGLPAGALDCRPSQFTEALRRALSGARACPKGRSRWPTSPSSSSPSGCPADALARHEAGQFFMIFPTIRTLQCLAQFADVDAVLAAVAGDEQPLWGQQPRSGPAGRQGRRASWSMRRYGSWPWSTQRPRRACARLVRAKPGAAPEKPAAPDRRQPRRDDRPGPTATWWATRHQASSPSTPARPTPAHLERLWRAAGGDIRMIVCTHSHRPFPGRRAAANHGGGRPRPAAARCWACRRPHGARRPASSRPTVHWAK